jgi:hypothetical protein
MLPLHLLTKLPGEWIQKAFRGKRPVKKDDVDFMGIKREKILDFSPIGSVHRPTVFTFPFACRGRRLKRLRQESPG